VPISPSRGGRTDKKGAAARNTTEGRGESSKPFLFDVQTLRERARKNLSEGVVTKTYGGDVGRTIEILQSVLATEIVCVLRYTMHAVTAAGPSSEAIRAEFAQNAKEEQKHMMVVAERIDQLGGTPDFNPDGLATRSASQYAEGENLVEMIRENLVAERIEVDHYRELIRYFGDGRIVGFRTDAGGRNNPPTGLFCRLHPGAIPG
jgi:bacterioferritin